MMSILKVALQNFSAYKKHYFKLISAFVSLMFLLTIFTTFSIAITDKYAEIKSKTVSSNYALSDVELEADKISVDYHTESIKSIDISSRSQELFGVPLDFITTQRLALIIDGATYRSSSEQFVTLYSSKEWRIFTDNDFAELGANNSDQLLIGSFPRFFRQLQYFAGYRREKNTNRIGSVSRSRYIKGYGRLRHIDRSIR